jgi:predicted enzyme related to lactoylglutathione lyase
MGWIPNTYLHGDVIVVIDCADLERAARFWTSVLGYMDEGQSTGLYRTLRPADGPGVEVLLQLTDDPKHGKNRVHLDLRTRDLDAEMRRVTELGATVLTEKPIIEGGMTWHVLADPDGNEFCVLQPSPAYWADR